MSVFCACGAWWADKVARRPAAMEIIQAHKARWATGAQGCREMTARAWQQKLRPKLPPANRMSESEWAEHMATFADLQERARSACDYACVTKWPQDPAAWCQTCCESHWHDKPGTP